MALPILPNTSNFLGVALVINRSRDGPRFVFHYPAHVISAQERSRLSTGGVGDGVGAGTGLAAAALADYQQEDDLHNHDDYDYDYDEAEDHLVADRDACPGISASAILGRSRNWDDHVITEGGTHIVPWEHVAGFPTKDLENLLTPARAYERTLFQISLDPIHCVSHPVYVPENGIWKKKSKKGKKDKDGDDPPGKRKKTNSPLIRAFDEQQLPPLDREAITQLGETHGDRSAADEAVLTSEGAAKKGVSPASSSPKGGGKGSATAGPAGGEDGGPGRHEGENVHGVFAAKGEGEAEHDYWKGEAEERDEKEDKVSSMTMFNLVFFLNPKKHEARELVNTMYTHIIRKVNKVYKYCQQRNDFVWQESKKILAMKDKAREERKKMTVLWNEILATSSLAASMQDVYEAISQNKIAVLQLGTQRSGALTHSVQIPAPFHVSDLPQEWDRDSEGSGIGLWITTADSFVGDDDAVSNEPEILDKNFALLLTDDDQKIVSELRSDPDETTTAMIEFMKHSKPTLSFHQVASQSKTLDLKQVRRFAHHFIFWRRAIAIPPLHMRDVYVMSPNCDLSRLPHDTAEMSKFFPWYPLPNLLSDLSAAPRPYKVFCPAKIYRPQYMRVLAWLMRRGWVTQICTFAYVVVWPEIIYEVEHALEAEELAREKAAAMAAAAQHEGRETNERALQLQQQLHRGDGDPRQQQQQPPFRGPRAPHGHRGDEIQEEDDDGGRGTTPRLRRSSSISQDPIETTAPSISSQTQLSPSAYATTPSSPTRRQQQHQIGGRPRPQPTPAQQAAEKARLDRLAEKAARELAEKASAHARKPQPTRTLHPSVSNSLHLAHISPYVILDAKTATGKESLYLSAIERRLRDRAVLARTQAAGAVATPTTPTSATMPGGSVAVGTSAASTLGIDILHQPLAVPVVAGTGVGRGATTGPGGFAPPSSSSPALPAADKWDERVAQAWPLFWKYFNGRSALERIALQEEMKRRDVWNLLTAMSEYLLCVRHW